MIHCLSFIFPDPEHSTVWRGIFVAGYVIAALCWLRAANRARASRNFFCCWIFGAIFLLLLAVNQAFDFRSHAEIFFRTLAQTHGWYEQRQPIQFLLAIVLPIIAGFIFLGIMLTFARPFFKRHPLALTGWFLLLLYLALRQAQEWKPAFELLNLIRYHDWRILLETAGIALVICAATTPKGD